MEKFTAIIKRISVIQALAFKESIRRRMILFLVICCVLFIGSGAGCTSACRGMQQQGLSLNLNREIARINKLEISADVKTKQIAELKKQFVSIEKKEARSLKSALLLVVFSMIAFWLFMISGIFTPFLAMNDFHDRTHIMILARPIQRWEYLVGKFFAIGSMLLLNLFVLLLSAFAFIYYFLDEPGWEILNGIGIFIHALILFTSMLIFLSLLFGRLPAIFLGITIVGIGVVPAVYLMTGNVDQISSPFNQGLVYALGYGLPQYALNFFYSLNQVLQEFSETSSFFKVGNNSGYYSIFINTGWLLVFWVLSLFAFARRQFDN